MFSHFLNCTNGTKSCKASHLHFFASVSISLFRERFSNDVVELPSNKGSFLLQSKYYLVSLIKDHYHLLMNYENFAELVSSKVSDSLSLSCSCSTTIFRYQLSDLIDFSV